MHIAKYPRHAIGHLLEHYERTAKNNGNEDIDHSRTELNYNLAPTGQTQMERIKKRLSEVRVHNRKDVNIICDCILTTPKDLPLGQEREFFQHAYDFLSRRYGAENVVSCYVHCDEGNGLQNGPRENSQHFHFCWVPVVPDKRSPGAFKLSAKECVDKKDLKTLHQDLQNYLNEKGIECSVLTGGTKAKGNRTITELKNETLKDETRQLTREFNELATEFNELANATTELKEFIRQKRIDRERGER